MSPVQSVNRLVFLNLILRTLSRAALLSPCRNPRDTGCWQASGPDPLHGFIRKGLGYCWLIEGGRNLHVSDFSMPPELRKYWGFSMTGIFVIPMITASGPISEDDGVLLPLETWWRGLAESSSLLMTEEEPKEPQKEEEEEERKGKRRKREKLIEVIHEELVKIWEREETSSNYRQCLNGLKAHLLTF